MYSYGYKLKEIRKALNMTQEQMSQKLGLTYRTYTSYERDENKPPLSMLDMLLLNFNVNLNWFVSNKGNMFNAPQYEDVKGEILKEVEMMLKNRGL